MKTRSGLVSNSSSTSFVVAFPKKPETMDDVWKFMFDGKQGGVSSYGSDGLALSQVAEILFNDLSTDEFKEATVDSIAETFVSRYNYNYRVDSSNTFWGGKTADADGGSWHYPINKYFGSDPKLLEELRQYYIEKDKISKALNKEEEKILERAPKSPEIHAYKGGENRKTKKPYTDKEIAETDLYKQKMDEFKKTDKAYVAYEKKRSKSWKSVYIELSALRTKVAMKDAKAFLNDNKGKFVFVISYSDNDGAQGATMEHGDIFRNVPHVVISNH